MTNKKKYQAPAFEVIKLKSRPRLLDGSPTAVEDGDGDEHDQNQNQYP